MPRKSPSPMAPLRPAMSAGDLHSTSPIFSVPALPAPGQAIEIVPGVYWLSTFLPFRLRAVNLWLLRDGDAWTMVDCGFPLLEVRRQIEAVWDTVLDGHPIRRLFVTHYHPDHAGNCRWICERWGIVPTMTSSEHAQSEFLLGQSWQNSSAARIAFWHKHGLSGEEVAEVDRSWNLHRALFAPPPAQWHPVSDGDMLQIAGTEWTVIVASGHAPEQALLYAKQRNLLISGDQVLPQITPNVSVRFEDPTAEPLSQFLESNRRLAQLCGDPMVLPSHKLPFLGLQARIQVIQGHHEERCELIEHALKTGPRTAASLIPVLFGNLKSFTGHDTGFALGESLAHLHYLVSQGRVTASEQEGVIVFAANPR